MNMLTFDLSIFDFIKMRMDIFFKENEGNLENCEFLIPIELNYYIERGNDVKVLSTNASGYGVTYKEDTPMVKDAIKKLKGIRCGMKSTSCPDQLAKALESMI